MPLPIGHVWLWTGYLSTVELDSTKNHTVDKTFEPMDGRLEQSFDIAYHVVALRSRV